MLPPSLKSPFFKYAEGLWAVIGYQANCYVFLSCLVFT